MCVCVCAGRRGNRLIHFVTWKARARIHTCTHVHTHAPSFYLSVCLSLPPSFHLSSLLLPPSCFPPPARSLAHAHSHTLSLPLTPRHVHTRSLSLTHTHTRWKHTLPLSSRKTSVYSREKSLYFHKWMRCVVSHSHDSMTDVLCLIHMTLLQMCDRCVVSHSQLYARCDVSHSRDSITDVWQMCRASLYFHKWLKIIHFNHESPIFPPKQLNIPAKKPVFPQKSPVVSPLLWCLCGCVCQLVCKTHIQGGEDAQNASSRRSLSAKKPLIIRIFCGK